MSANIPRDQAYERILERLREGWSYANACTAAGVARRTFYNWRQEDPEFEAKVAEALEAGLDTAEDAIRRHWRRDWRAAHATLVARRQAVYGRQRLEVTGADGGPLQVTDLSDTDRAARVAALLAAAAARKPAEPDDELLA